VRLFPFQGLLAVNLVGIQAAAWDVVPVEIEIPQFAEALGDGGRGAHVNGQERALLDPGVMIAPAAKANSTPRPRRSLTLRKRDNVTARLGPCADTGLVVEF